MYQLGDIQINGKPYRIDLDSYRVKDLADFSPRASVPGGSIIMSELLLYQTLTMTDWRHGFGFMWHTDSMGYMVSKNDVDTRFPGTIMISTAPVQQNDTVDSAKNGFVEWNGYLYSWSSTGLRQMDFSTGVWSNIYSGSVNFAFPTENYLFFCPTGGRLKKLDKSNTQTDAGINANSTDYDWMVIYRGFIYAGKRNKNEVYYANEDDLSDLHGSPNDDPNVVYVGGGNYPTLGALSFGGYLYVFRKDGIWTIGDDKISRMVLDFSNEMNDKNFKSRTVYNGYLYFNVGIKIYQWNGSRLVDQTPPRMSDKYPYDEIFAYGQMTTANNFLFLNAIYKLNNPTTYEYGLFCFDGVGWHKLNSMQYSGLTDAGILYLAPNIKRLFLSLSGNPAIVLSISLGEGHLPHPYYRANVNHELYTPRLDMGFRRIRKSSPSILVEASNVNQSRYIEIYYALDGGNYILWGRVTNNGITELTNPGSNNTIEFNYLNLKIVLYTASYDQTPILEGLTVRFLLRPDVFYGYNFNIVASNNYIYGNRQDNRSPAEILNELKLARDSKSPISFVDIFNQQHYGYISAITLMASERHEMSDDGIPNIESRININFVEVR